MRIGRPDWLPRSPLGFDRIANIGRMRGTFLLTIRPLPTPVTRFSAESLLRAFGSGFDLHRDIHSNRADSRLSHSQPICARTVD